MRYEEINSVRLMLSFRSSHDVVYVFVYVIC